VTYEITEFPAGLTEIHPKGAWIVEKVLSGEERILIATFSKRDRAEKCLESFRHSIEIERGASILYGRVAAGRISS
jgi:hypothetical protein